MDKETPTDRFNEVEKGLGHGDKRFTFSFFKVPFEIESIFNIFKRRRDGNEKSKSDADSGNSD